MEKNDTHPSSLFQSAISGDTHALAIRRDRVAQASRSLAALKAVQRISSDSVNFHETALQGLPLIIEGVVGDWSINSYKRDDLRHSFGALKVFPRMGDYVMPLPTEGVTSNEMTLLDYLDLIEQAGPTPPPYIGDHSLPISSMCDWPPYFENWHTPRVWLGPSGTVTRLHCDFEDNLFAQIWGRKRFLLYPHSARPNLYIEEVHPTLFISSFDPEYPNYDLYPLARSEEAVECILEPGDLLYLPAGWFHHVKALDFSLSVNRWTPDEPIIITASN
jgi:hypothetical protein